MRRIVGILLRPLWRLIVRVTPEGDPWERVDVVPRLQLYGIGARLDFSKYFEGPSSVSIESIEELQAWLLGCTYQSDESLFGERDFWQHPVTFERLRAGDCEDFALYAWRKLVELDIDADFIAGYTCNEGALGGRHAWIVFRHDKQELLFEPAWSNKSSMIRPLAEVRHNYIPQVGVDRTGKRFGFSGYLTAAKRQHESRSRRTA